MKTWHKLLGHRWPSSMPNMTGRQGCQTMENQTIGGSSVSYLARTLASPYFLLCVLGLETEVLLDYQGKAGIISIVRWNLRPVILCGLLHGVKKALPRKKRVGLFYLRLGLFHLRLVFVACGNLVWSFLLTVENRFGLFYLQFPPSGKLVWFFVLTVAPCPKIGFGFFYLRFPTVSKKRQTVSKKISTVSKKDASVLSRTNVCRIENTMKLRICSFKTSREKRREICRESCGHFRALFPEERGAAKFHQKFHGIFHGNFHARFQEKISRQHFCTPCRSEY